MIILFGIDAKINIFVSVGEMRNEDASEIIKEICEKIGGKGGGKKNMAQGVGENKKILEKFINEIKKKYQWLYGRSKNTQGNGKNIKGGYRRYT